MKHSRFVGADGCKGGAWVCVATDGRGAWSIAVHASIGAVWDASRGAERVLLDIPIGLMEHGRRACDVAARRSLGSRRSSVFPSPERWLLACTSLAEADGLKSEREGRAVKVQRQMWNILPRVREVDAWLRQTPPARAIVRECHPELCFMGLSGRPMGHNKKTVEGRGERIELLREHVPAVGEMLADALTRWPRSVLAADDVVDAVVAAVCAAAPDNVLRTVPSTPEVDEHGLPMEMVYRLPG